MNKFSIDYFQKLCIIITMLQKKIVAVIMGGGQGVRLFPLTKDRCKPAVPIGGRYRLIDIPISNSINSGLKKINILTQFNTSSLHRHIERTYRFDNFSDGFCTIRSAEQTTENTNWYQGTADAVRQNLRYILAFDSEYVLILSGDQLYRMNYMDLAEFHIERKADVTICVNPVARDRAKHMGLLHVDDNLKIKDFVEKPKEDELLDKMKTDPEMLARFGFTVNEDRNYMANMGIYFFNADVLKRILLGNSMVDFGREVMPSNIEHFKMFAFPFTGFWEDLGTIDAFYKVNMSLLDRNPEFNFFDPSAPIYTRPRFLPPTKIMQCTIDHSLVSEGGFLEQCVIHRCLLSDRCVIRNNSVLRDVFMMGADFMEGKNEREENRRKDIPDIGVGQDCLIERVIIDKGARIGSGVRIRRHENEPDRDGEFYYIRDGITIIPRRAIVPSGSEI